MESLFSKGFQLSISIRKSLHTSYVLSDKRAGRVLRKFLGGNENSKKKFYINESPTMPNPYTFSKGSVEGKPSGNSRRAKILNKIFMRHITDLMATGECASEILGHGIEINRVKIAPDYKIINVYWISKSQDIEKIEGILRKSAGYLRHEMSELRVIGEIPRIQFVKDKNYWNLAEVDAALQRADFGDEYEPSEIGNKFKNEFELLTSIDPNIKELIHKFEDQTVDDTEEVPLPPMPQNVLGLDHKDILNRINTALKKSKTLPNKEINENWSSFKVNQTLNESPVTLGSEKSQRKAFKEFLQQRQITKSKARSENKYPCDTVLIREELLRKTQTEFDDLPLFKEDDDYISEELDENKQQT